MTSFALRTAARCLHQGGVICYPTEAVFGLGCDPANDEAVERVLQIKQRDHSKGLLLIAATLEQLLPWVELSAAQQQQLSQHWPASTSYLLTASRALPHWIRGQHSKVGVRVTQHTQARDLCLAFGGALVSTSANLSGQPPVRTQLQAQRQFGAEVDMIIPGECDLHGKPSTIIDLDSGATIRA